MTKLIAAGGFLVLNCFLYYFFATQEVTPPRETFESFPLQFESWTCSKRARMEEGVEKVLGVTDYLLCNYANTDQKSFVGVYIGYHESQVRTKGGENANLIHPPKHCLPGSGWDIIQAEQVPLPTSSASESAAMVNRFIIAKGESRQLVYYWYQSRGRVIADDWKKIIYLFWDRATKNRSDGALVRLTMNMGAGDEDEAFRSLLAEVMPLLDQYVPE